MPTGVFLWLGPPLAIDQHKIVRRHRDKHGSCEPVLDGNEVHLRNTAQTPLGITLPQRLVEFNIRQNGFDIVLDFGAVGQQRRATLEQSSGSAEQARCRFSWADMDHVHQAK
ncbi:hypothetical protein [Qipengyuania sp. SM2507]